MMKSTLEERFRKKMVKFAKKNKFCYYVIFPIYSLGLSLFSVITYFKNNGKRFAMLGMSGILFVVYSSFSFPVFVNGTENNGLQEISEGVEDIALAREAEVDMDEIVLLGEQGISDVFDSEESNTFIEEVIRVSTSVSQEAEDKAVGVITNVVEEKNGADAGAGDSAAGEEKSTAGADVKEDAGIVTDEGLDAADKKIYQFEADDWKIMLVNKQHFVPDDYEFPMGCIHTDRGAMYCDERTIEPLLAMFDAAAKDGVTIRIQSPYRDYKYQKLLFDRKVKLYMDKGLSYLEAFQTASTIVTVPGASEHQTGLAFDLLSNNYNSLDYGFGNTDAGKWLAKHSHEYGFILRYPDGKQHITDIIYEPWHFRYVGVEAATVMKEEGLCLEEFWEEYL